LSPNWTYGAGQIHVELCPKFLVLLFYTDSPSGSTDAGTHHASFAKITCFENLGSLIRSPKPNPAEFTTEFVRQKSAKIQIFR